MADGCRTKCASTHAWDPGYFPAQSIFLPQYEIERKTTTFTSMIFFLYSWCCSPVTDELARQSTTTTTTKVNILWLNVFLNSYWFSKVTFWTPSLTLVSWDFINALCTLFSCFIWHYQTVFGVMERTLGSSQFCIQVVEQRHEQRHENCNYFGHQLFLFLWSELLMMYCSILSPQEKVIYWVLPNPFLTHYDWQFQ